MDIKYFYPLINFYTMMIILMLEFLVRYDKNAVLGMKMPQVPEKEDLRRSEKIFQRVGSISGG